MTALAIVIREDDLSGAPARDLLRLHLEGMHASSPADGVFALDLSALRHPSIEVWTAWEGQAIAGIAALRSLGPRHGEIKSMRTHPAFLRRGVGAALLDHIIAIARGRGFARLSLETGSGEAFDPALALYRTRRFAEGDAFGEYSKSAFNRFLHLDL